MHKTSNSFKLYSKYGLEGYYIQVRNTFSNSLEKEFIPLKAKELFEKSFGDRIPDDSEFLEWYMLNAGKFI